MNKRTVLITGCSDGGLGAALALEFHKRGHYVLATARNPKKMAILTSTGIETLPLDVLSANSISSCAASVRKLLGGRLDILINNAGAIYHDSVAEMSIPEAKELFDLNVWAPMAVTQAFLPMLMQSSHGGIVANNSSGAALISTPFMTIYGASKAALSMLTCGLQTEMAAFNIKAVDMKTCAVESKLFHNSAATHSTQLSPSSMFYAARDIVEKALRGEHVTSKEAPIEKWAKDVVNDLLRSRTPLTVWRGATVWDVWLGQFLPLWLQGMITRNIIGMGEIEKRVREYGVERAMADHFGDEAIAKN